MPQVLCWTSLSTYVVKSLGKTPGHTFFVDLHDIVFLIFNVLGHIAIAVYVGIYAC